LEIVGAEKSVGCCRLVVTTFSVLCPLLPDIPATMKKVSLKFICCFWNLGVVVTSFLRGGGTDGNSRHSWDLLDLGISQGCELSWFLSCLVGRFLRREFRYSGGIEIFFLGGR
jgi:hypothetical protein